jgi:hypothetical protein
VIGSKPEIGLLTNSRLYLFVLAFYPLQSLSMYFWLFCLFLFLEWFSPVLVCGILDFWVWEWRVVGVGVVVSCEVFVEFLLVACIMWVVGDFKYF